MERRQRSLKSNNRRSLLGYTPDRYDRDETPFWARVLMLAPTLVMFAFIRRDGGPKGKKTSLVDHLPQFVLGYLALAVVRALGDRAFGDAPVWASFLSADKLLVDLTMATVSASIGMHLAFRTLLSSGAPAVAVGGGAALTIASLTLGMITFASRVT